MQLYQFRYCLKLYINLNTLIMNDKSSFQKEKNWFLTRRPSNKLIFIILGVVSTLWFIIRVVPKPSRANYPCMQAAAPFAASFISYLAGISITVLAVQKLRTPGRNVIASLFAFLGLFVGIFLFVGGDNATGRAGIPMLKSDEPPNTPMGVARGIHPGRVVWVWDANATDESCTNEPGDYWFQDDNVNAQVITDMLSKSLQLLAGEDSDSLAWDALFRHYNETHGNGNAGYQEGQKIAIKINLTTGGWGNVDLATYDKVQNLEMMDGTPQLILAMLEQLVEVVGVAQEDIAIGDPIRNFYNQYWDPCHSRYPNIKYLDSHGLLGRSEVINSSNAIIFYSDGTVLDSLPTAYEEADYMINMGCLKQHDLAGGTFCAKNHFGSCGRDWALHLHYALPSPTSNGFENLGYFKFRNLVDLMEHEDLGEKTMLFLVDGIWGGELPVTEPVKWQIEPFNDDWPNSIFVSQDHVAIESVGLDFVRAQFDDYADMLGADDYLHQAADSANWADGIIYDPENDGVIIPSMGVHEHWNNDIDKQYTRDLGTGDGIELLRYLITGLDNDPLTESISVSAYPNPFSEKLSFKFKMEFAAGVHLSIFASDGKLVWSARTYAEKGDNQMHWNAGGLPGGVYFYNIYVEDNKSMQTMRGKVVKAGI